MLRGSSSGGSGRQWRAGGGGGATALTLSESTPNPTPCLPAWEPTLHVLWQQRRAQQHVHGCNREEHVCLPFQC
jgi:hypothetical protein